MKVKNLFELCGLRNRPRRYLYSTKTCLFDDQTVRYAQWLHPKEFRKEISGEQVAAYRSILRPGDFCIDIGAHTGDSTLPMALAVGRSGCVLALEPNPFVYHVLEKNARANRSAANIIPMMAAATEKEGFMQFAYSDSGFCNGGRHEDIGALKHGHAYKLDVFGVNLARELRDDFSDLLPRLRFIKVDAEGYDLSIVQSLSEVIQTHRPYLKVEVFGHTSTEYRKKLISFFLDRGFEVFKIQQEPIQAGPRLTLNDVNAWKHFDVLCVPSDLGK